MIYQSGSRVCHVPSLNTMHRIMADLGGWEIGLVKTLYDQPPHIVKIIADNVQHFLRAHEARMWKTNKLVYGMAATSVEMDFVDDSSAFNLDRKQEAIAQGNRKALTVNDLHQLINAKHRLLVGDLHWLNILVSAIPQLRHLKPQVDKLFEDLPASLRIPSDHQTRMHPLQSNGRNETIITDLKAAVLDFLAQHGITKHTFRRVLVLFGGDGLTYEKLLALKTFLQTHLCPFQSLRILHPFLESWHMIWTDLSRLCSTHWGDLKLKDPSTLAKCANEIHRKPPPNFTKVEYYQWSETVHLVLSARMLDCWR
jgi:hypothetical protein